MDEVWKDIKGYEGLYQASNRGRIRSCTRDIPWGNSVHRWSSRVLKQGLCPSTGYLKVSLHKDKEQTTLSVHRIIAETFIPNPDKLPEVDHINTVRTDNRAENLRWVTRKGNMNNKITKIKVSKYFVNGVAISDAEKAEGVSHSLVLDRLRRGWSIADACTKSLMKGEH